jgi:Flp pilus assembly protein TadB
MDLAAAWNHLSQREPDTSAASWGWRGALRALPDRLTDAARRVEHPWLGIPTTDLALLNTTPRAYVQRRLRGAGIGAVAGILLGISPLLVGVDLAFSLVPLLAPAGLAVGALWPVWRVREAAAAARHDARRALATYLELVAGERASGAAPAPAVTQAAALGQHWLFTRLQQTLTYAHRTGQTPWAALRELGTQLQLAALIEVADLADTASEGAAVYDSLTAQAASLRHHTRSTDRAAANAASERLTLPTSLLMLSFLLLVLYPTTAHLLGI